MKIVFVLLAAIAFTTVLVSYIISYRKGKNWLRQQKEAQNKTDYLDNIEKQLAWYSERQTEENGQSLPA
jgi:predicted PurR-regulated permease PerM